MPALGDRTTGWAELAKPIGRERCAFLLSSHLRAKDRADWAQGGGLGVPVWDESGAGRVAVAGQGMMGFATLYPTLPR